MAPKNITKLWKPALAAILSAAGVAGTAFAADQSPSSAQLLQLIQQQQRQINELKAALTKTKGTAEKAAATAADAQANAQASAQANAQANAKGAAAGAQGLLSMVKVGGTMEVETTSTKTFAGATSSDITLAKVEVYFDAQPHEYLATHVQLLYEDAGSENITLDEAHMTLGNTEKFPLYLRAGKWAQGFGGAFDTAMSTDPLTKNLGETKEAAIAVGVTKGGATLEGYVYNGDTQKTGEGNNIDQFGLSASYATTVNGIGFDGGVGYIRNMADSDGLTEGLGTNATAIADYIGGFEAHAAMTIGDFTLRGGYMAALDAFQAGEIAFNGKGAKPKAWVTEASYATKIMDKDTTFALTVQGTKEALALGYPETRVGGAVTVGIFDKVAVTGEYLHDEDYGTADGGTGNSGHTATLKLAAEF